MNSEARAHLKQLLEGQRVLSLAVIVDSEPHIGLLPFAVLPDHSGVLVHVSTLAKHTRGIAAAKTVAVLIHQSEEAVGDPLQVPRVSLHAGVREIRRESPEYDESKSRYLSRFADAAVTFELADFRLFELKFRDGRFVEGFARAMDITPEDLQALTPPDQPKPEAEGQHERRRWMVPRD